MVATGSVQEMFDDAKGMHSEALERLAAGDIRDAAEKAWCATKRGNGRADFGPHGRGPCSHCSNHQWPGRPGQRGQQRKAPGRPLLQPDSPTPRLMFLCGNLQPGKPKGASERPSYTSRTRSGWRAFNPDVSRRDIASRLRPGQHQRHDDYDRGAGGGLDEVGHVGRRHSRAATVDSQFRGNDGWSPIGPRRISSLADLGVFRG